MKRYTNYSEIAIVVIALLFVGTTHSLSGENKTKPSDKIYSIVTLTIEKLKKDGVTANNAKQMNLAKRYNTLVTRFDVEGRFGLHLDVTEVTPSLIAKLQGLAGDVVMALPYSKLVAVYLPIDKIEEVAAYDEVKIIRPIVGGITNTGSVTSEGDSIHHAINVRTDLNVKGDSINVGVISDGAVNWTTAQDSGDLPSTFDSTHYTFLNGNKSGCNDEGTAMMEIVHDLAPNAELYFYGALCDPAGSAAHVDAIHRLVREKGCKVIVDDLNWWDEPMFEDGTPATNWTVAAAIQWAIDTGVVYVASAGNWARGGFTDRSHYQATYQSVSTIVFGGQPNPWTQKPLQQGAIPNFPHFDNCGACPPFCGPCPPDPYHQLHEFGPGAAEDPGLKVIVPPDKVLSVILQWNDPWGSSTNDYDLYLYKGNLQAQVPGAMSINIQNGGPNQNPYEIIHHPNYYPWPETLNIVINRFQGLPKLLKMFIFGCSWVEYNTVENSIYGHHGIEDLISVGAVPYDTIDNIESYSSRGNFDVYFPAYQSRPKPDLVAIDGGVITGAGGFGRPDGANMRFYGTSASAPHVAAMAALLLSKCPTLTPQQVHAKLERTAIDLGAAGFDQTYGHGRVDIERAMLELNTNAGVYGPDQMNNTVNIPMFFASADGYAIDNIKITGGDNQPNQVNSTVNVTAGSPYADAGVTELGCPTAKRYYQLTQTGGTNGSFNAQIVAYVDETERANAGVTADELRLLHWNGAYFDIIPQTSAPAQVGNTWKISASFNNASFSPFFVGYLTHGIDVAKVTDGSGAESTEVEVALSVQNLGNGWDTLSVRVYDTRGWTLSFAQSALSLTSSQIETLSVGVTVSVNDIVGTIDTVWLVASSVSDPSYSDSMFATVQKTESEVTMSYTYTDKWNMVSVPLIVSDYTKTTIYPSAVSAAFSYNGGYLPQNMLANGVGYWLKFSGEKKVSMTGSLRTTDTIDVSEGWNMIGSISTPVDVVEVTSDPAGIVTSQFFGYSGTYVPATSIDPGKSYWVKVNQTGKLILSKTGASTSARIKIIPTIDLPPSPPENTETMSLIPSVYSLEQNYPNPFNPTTVITFDLPTASIVTLRVYNMIGQEVKVLAESQLYESGRYEKVVDASGLSSGMYYYSLFAKSTDTEGMQYKSVKKMMLVR